MEVLGPPPIMPTSATGPGQCHAHFDTPKGVFFSRARFCWARFARHKKRAGAWYILFGPMTHPAARSRKNSGFGFHLIEGIPGYDGAPSRRRPGAKHAGRPYRRDLLDFAGHLGSRRGQIPPKPAGSRCGAFLTGLSSFGHGGGPPRRGKHFRRYGSSTGLSFMRERASAAMTRPRTIAAPQGPARALPENPFGWRPGCDVLGNGCGRFVARRPGGLRPDRREMLLWRGLARFRNWAGMRPGRGCAAKENFIRPSTGKGKQGSRLFPRSVRPARLALDAYLGGARQFRAPNTTRTIAIFFASRGRGKGLSHPGGVFIRS